jgi:hypothetical protein
MPTLYRQIAPFVSSADISVVIAGLVQRDFPSGDLSFNCIRSLRKNLPGAELILSTWTHCDTVGLDVDILIQIPEPAPILDCTGRESNFHRQRIAVAAGLMRAQRKFVLKFRPDLILENCTIVEAFTPHSNEQRPSLLSERVVITNLFIPNPLRDPTLYHLSDIVHFGFRRDIVRIWTNNVAASVSPIGNHRPRRIIGNFSGYTYFRMLPEQALTTAWLTAEGLPITLTHINDGSAKQLEDWLTILFSNFRIVDAHESGIRFPERFFANTLTRHNVTEGLSEVPLYVSQAGRHKALRHFTHFANKYLTCWFNRNYLRSVAHVIVISLSSGLINRIKNLNVNRNTS